MQSVIQPLSIFRIRLVLIGLLALLCFQLPVNSANLAFAQMLDDSEIDTPGLMVECSIGWNNIVDQSTPTPISLLLTNHSKRNIEARLFLTTQRGQRIDLGEVFIGAGSTRRYSTFKALPYLYFAYLSLEADRVVWQRTFNVNGTQFDYDQNYLLFVDNGQRKLQLPGIAGTNAANIGGNFNYDGSQVTVAGETGRSVTGLQAKIWQMPTHEGPLEVFHAIVFSDSFEPSDLNKGQWNAIGRWMCAGGTVFVHTESERLIDVLLKQCPLSAEPALQSGPFKVRLVGLGSIQEYSIPLFDNGNQKLLAEIESRTARLTRAAGVEVVRDSYIQSYDVVQNRAEFNRMAVVAFFVIYTVLAGVVTLLMFRASRRKVGTYTVFIVGAGVVAAASLGGYLAISRGDLKVVTVTQGGAGGVVEFAKLTAQSAGSRSNTVCVSGENVDLQFVGESRVAPGWSRSWSPFDSYSEMPNGAPKDFQSQEDRNACQIRFPIAPWGKRQLNATAFHSDLKKLDLKLAYRRPTSEKPGGEFEIELTNNLPFELKDPVVVIGSTLPNQDQAVIHQQQMLIFNGQRIVSVGKTSRKTFAANLKSTSRYEFLHGWTGEKQARLQAKLPSLTMGKTVKAWVVGRIDAATSLQVEADYSDFLLRDELHLYVQEIAAEDLPDFDTLHNISGD